MLQNKKLRLVGEYMRGITADLLDAMAAKPLREVMSPDQIAELVASAKRELNDMSNHIYVDFFFWYAQKPAGGS